MNDNTTKPFGLAANSSKNAQGIDLDFDRQHLWHPYTSLVNPLPVYPVQSACGVQIRLSNGTQLVDGMASWWSAIHGYNHPALNQALNQQTSKMSHVMFGGLTHQPAVELGKRLVAMTPEPLDAVFIADSGSISVEVAIKMAIQFQVARGKAQKHKLATIRNGYHGDTFAAMSVCDPINGMHELFTGILTKHLFASAPTVKPDEDFDPAVHLHELETLFKQHHQEMAAFILEPIVQGAGGMRFYHPGYLQGISQLCDTYDVLLIADEIATGFGRTGKLFACEHTHVIPDIMCVGKALTGGYMTLAATIATREVAHTIGHGPGGGSLMHGPTFMGNPLACAVAVASLDLVIQGDWKAQVESIEKQLAESLLPCNNSQSYPLVHEARVFGAIGVLEMKSDWNVAKVQAFFVENGVWIRPFGKLLYIMPPYSIELEQLQQLTDSMKVAARCSEFLSEAGNS